MSDCNFENFRNQYKPEYIKVLFIGESIPQGGTFFYKENSILYNETKKAFNEYLGNEDFSYDYFQQIGCWLYDICDKPVNGSPKNERKECIHNNIPRLVEFVQQEKPDYIIVCKKGFVEKEVKRSVIMDTYRDEEDIFFLPFPGFGNQKNMVKV